MNVFKLILNVLQLGKYFKNKLLHFLISASGFCDLSILFGVIKQFLIDFSITLCNLTINSKLAL